MASADPSPRLVHEVELTVRQIEEVDFNPELDDYFGVRNVKRGVEPHDELRHNLRDRLAKYLPVARAKLYHACGRP